MENARPSGWICLTGGEPFAQAVGPLVEQLRQSGFRLQVETNGTIPAGPSFDWVTVSPKPPDYDVVPEFRQTAREVKLVVSRELSFAALRRVRSEFPSSVPVILQPESNRPESRARAVRLLERSLRETMPDIRLGIQLHKVYGFS